MLDKHIITTAQQLTMLSSKMDVLQLTDMFQNFGKTSTLEYDPPLYSCSLPGYEWEAGSKLPNIKLDFIKINTSYYHWRITSVEKFPV